MRNTQAFFLHPSVAEFVGDERGDNILLVGAHIPDFSHIQLDNGLPILKTNRGGGGPLASGLRHIGRNGDFGLEPAGLNKRSDGLTRSA